LFCKLCILETEDRVSADSKKSMYETRAEEPHGQTCRGKRIACKKHFETAQKEMASACLFPLLSGE